MNWQRALFDHSIKILCFLSLIFSYTTISFSDAEGVGKISGYIFNSANQPLTGVEVRAIAYSGPYFHRITYSAPDGSYEIDQLPIGQYYVRVQNKLGYLNVFYDNAIDKSNATLIKINESQHVSAINFYLERGGFISGHIYDSQGNLLTTNTSIGFFDADNFSSYGFINGNSDGSYISPALPNRPHIIKASALPLGYVMTYFDDVSTQDSAQSVYVFPDDTVKNIDFHLDKGGVISGYVRGEHPGYEPVPDAWVVVTNWENGEWSSESITDSTGYYCAAGLRHGEYRVHVYGIDPTRYHNEYYQNSAQYENATKVYVIDHDTTHQINFSLKPVERLVLFNDFIEFAVSDRYPGTNFSLGITGGLPETPHDDNKPILFGHPFPYTSFTTIWIDGKELLFGSNDGDLVEDPYISQDRKSIGRTWNYKGIEVKQKVSLVISEWSETKYEDTAQIQYIITNNDNMPHQIGVRMLFDTMLGRDDAVPIRTSNFPQTGYEQDFYGSNIPAWWTAIEGEQNKTLFSVQGTLKDFGAIVPDRFSIVNWSNIFQTKWNYGINPDLPVINDSGVALWWYPMTVPPGNTRIVCTFVGLGEMYPDKEPPYTANHIPAKDSVEVALDTNIQLDVLDDYMGVDTTTIVMMMNGEVVTPHISGTLSQVRLFYDPVNNFQYNDTVQIIVEASDLAIVPNRMVPDTFQFYISSDILPPIVENLYPEHRARNIAPDTCLSFSLRDEQSGVNKESIQVFINGNLINPEIEGNQREYSVRYLFQPPFNEMDSVSIRILASDLVTPSNKLDNTFYFWVTRDSIPPWVKAYYPADQAREVDLDTMIVIELVDDFAGVDYHSIQLQLNNTLVTPQITGDSSHFLIRYRPENGFHYNEQKNVTLWAQDLAKMTNTMIPFEFLFYTATDTIPPLITLATPSAGDTNVIPTPFVAVEIKDEKAGVDPTSIIMKINGNAVPYQLNGNDKFYIASYQCETTFNYLDWISVTLFARDKSNPPNESDTTTFRFRITREKDLSPPYVTLYQPAKGANNVAPDCLISFHVKDDLSGVDSSSIKLKIDGTLVSRKIRGNVHDYIVEYQPLDLFDYGQQVLLEVDAQDLAKDPTNVMSTDSSIFTIMLDTSPPGVVWIKPGQPGDHIPLDSEFIVQISDSLTGVDVNSLKFKFEGAAIYPRISGAPNSYQIQFIPVNRLQFNQQIEFVVTGTDLAKTPNRIQDSLFIFYTIEDHDPPYITLRVPDRNKTGIPFNPEITVTIKDDVAGVDRDSLKMTVAGMNVMPVISGDLHEIKMSYTDPQRYRPGQEIKVTIDGADLSNPPNSMTTDKYSFFIQEVFPDLFIESFSVDPTKILVHKPVQFASTIEVATAPVFDPIHIRLLDNERVIMDTTLQPMSVSEYVDIARSYSFNHKGKHQLKLVIDPENQIIESDEQNNIALKIVEVLEGELVVRSNPFTPNGDGINDDVTFNFEKLGVVDPTLRLFDVSGRMINTLKKGVGFKFVWDGTDRFGNQAQPGVYLYLIEDRDKTIANGYVVLAR